eukprot:s2621_g7.t1
MSKLFLTILKHPCKSLRECRDYLQKDECAMVTDCKGLYDAVQRETIQQATDKRVAIEGLLIKDMLKDLKCQWRWVSSERQLADGMTKVGARQAFVERFKGGYIQLVADETYQAAKRKSKADRERTVQETRGSKSAVAQTLIALVLASNVQPVEGALNAQQMWRLANFAVLSPFVLTLALLCTTVLWFACARTRNSIRAWWTRTTEGLRAANARLQAEVNQLQIQVAELERRSERDNLIMCRNTADLDDYRDTVKDLRQAAESRKKQISDLERELEIARSRRGQDVVREVYLRDDISPEAFEGADQDTNIVLHQIDLIAEDECVNHVVVPYTVLQEVRHRNMGIYSRLRALCRVETGDAREDQVAEEELNEEPAPASNAKRGVGDREKARDMASARNARKNEFFRETYVERLPQESQNDRNDRAIRRVAHWYRRHIVGPEVVLLTDDKACQGKAVQDGLLALRAAEFVEKMRKKFLGEIGGFWSKKMVKICVALTALGWLWSRPWSPLGPRGAAPLLHGDLRFVWQAWRLVTSAFFLCGRLGTYGTGLPWSPLVRVAPRFFCVTGVALGDICLRFVWQAWHLQHWAGSGGGLGRRWSLGRRASFAWQAWRLVRLLVPRSGNQRRRPKASHAVDCMDQRPDTHIVESSSLPRRQATD